MDAPAHFPPGKEYLDQIPVAHLFAPAVVIDVRDEVSKDPDYRLRVMRVEKWEALHGRIPAGAVVLLRTGWASRWPDQARYRNMDAARRDALSGIFGGGGAAAYRARRGGPGN